MRSSAPSTWVFRVLLLVVNVAGIWWIHHDLTAAALPGLRILAALPARDVEKTDRFTFVFDRPLSLPGAPGEASLSGDPFDIVPKLPGRWFWAAPERLEYRLDKQLPLGRRLTIQASPTLEQMLGRRLLGTAQFHFETGSLKLTSCVVTSSDGQNANLEFKFSQPVDPADLLRHLRLSDADSSGRLPVQVLNKAPDATLAVRTDRPASDKIVVHLNAALTGAGAELPLAEEVKQSLEVKSAFAVVTVEAQQAAINEDGCIKIRFSKPLDAKSVFGTPHCIQVDPTVDNLRLQVDYEWLIARGKFASGQTYTATLSPELRSNKGETLGREETVSAQVPEQEPGLHFETGGGILSRHGNLLLDMKYVNVSTACVQAGRVHPNNLVSHLRGESKEATSREFPEKTFHLEGTRNEPATVAVDLRKLLGEPLGTYWISARGPNGTWASDSAVVAITDLGITTKQERNGFCVWVTSLSSAHPVAEAEVTAVTYNNQVIARANTDRNGLARLEVPPNNPDGPAWLITARLGEDISYIEPQKRPWVLDDVDQAGRASPLTYDVMLYTERGVYRPGETVHLTGIIRDAAGNVPPPFPLAATVCRPDGKQIAQLTIPSPSNRQGVFQIDYACPDLGQTGPYRFRVGLPGAKDVLGGADALVEEYAPQRLELKAAARARFGPGEPVQVEATARYLFDQAAADLPVRVNATYRRQTYQSKRYAEFEFSPPDARVEQRVPEWESKLDESGHATLILPSPSLVSPGLWKADMHVTVSQEGGRSVSRSIESCVDVAGRHLGLRLPRGRIASTSTPTPVEWVQVGADDAPASPGPATFTLTHVRQDTTLQQVDGRYVWKTTERTTQIDHADLPAAADHVGLFEVVCPEPGLYRLAATDCASGAITQIEFRATDDTIDAVAASGGEPDRVALTLDRDSYLPGSTARLAVEAPFAGTMLVTVETDRVIDARVYDLARRSAEVELPIDAGIRGGAFITATIVRRIAPDEQTWLPHRAVGMARLRTDHAARRLDLAVNMPAQARPGQTVPVKVQTTTPSDPANPPIVHLWAVDEGILLATDFTTPDAAGYFFAPRQAEIISADVFADLIPDYRRPAGMTRIGGDGGDEEAYSRRVESIPLPRQMPAMIWRTALPVGPDGRVTAELLMPELTGRLRVMAVAVDQDRYGSASAPLVLTTPLLVEMSCPRFAAPDDVIQIPVKVFNSTDTELNVNLDLVASGPLRVDQLPPSTLTVAPHRPTVVWAQAVATGLGSVSISARAESKSRDGESLTGRQLATFGIRPAGSLHSESQIISINAGEPYQFVPQDKWVPGTAEAHVTLGPRPTVQLKPAVEELIEYPYGCVEQTTSQLYVLLHAPDLLKLDAGGSARADAVGRMINAGLARLWSMQTRCGGLGYWPGDSYACTWGTAYAAEFVAAAERKGYTASPAFTVELVQYLAAQLEAGGKEDEDIDANLKAQLCYVLARMNQPKPSWMLRLGETIDELDVAGRAYLAGAWLEAGRKDRAAAILTDDVLEETAAAADSSRPTSQVHQDSVLLSILMDLDPQHPWIPLLVKRLEKARVNGHWGSTMENAGALAALSRYQLIGEQPASFEGVVRQGETTQPFSHLAAQTFRLRADQPLEITSTGQGRIHGSMTFEGLLKDNTQPEYDRKLTVSRQWLDRTGKPIDTGRLRVGDLIVVEVSLAAPGLEQDDTIDNIAVVDALPGGMEVENPRLANTETDAKANSSTADHVEFRDDRVVVFSSATRGKRVFRYALRAITAGSFAVPAVQASSMYDSSIASLHGAGRVSIAR